MKIELNDVSQLFYKLFSEKIIFFVGNNSQMIEKSNADFSDFLFGFHGQETKIKNYLISCNAPTPPKKIFCYIKNTENYRFLFSINRDKSSVFEVSLIKKIRKEFDTIFLEEKIYKEHGYVYILKSNFGYKIGCTGSLRQRMGNFKKQFPFKIELHSLIKCVGYSSIEGLLHKSLAHKRINGEWFKLSKSDFLEMDLILSNIKLKRKPYKEEWTYKPML